MAKRKVVVIKESKTGANERFKDTTTDRYMSRTEFTTAIKNGTYPDYHTRSIGGKDTPVSNPNRSKGDNLG